MLALETAGYYPTTAFSKRGGPPSIHPPIFESRKRTLEITISDYLNWWLVHLWPELDETARGSLIKFCQDLLYGTEQTLYSRGSAMRAYLRSHTSPDPLYGCFYPPLNQFERITFARALSPLIPRLTTCLREAKGKVFTTQSNPLESIRRVARHMSGPSIDFYLYRSGEVEHWACQYYQEMNEYFSRLDLPTDHVSFILHKTRKNGFVVLSVSTSTIKINLIVKSLETQTANYRKPVTLLEADGFFYVPADMNLGNPGLPFDVLAGDRTGLMLLAQPDCFLEDELKVLQKYSYEERLMYVCRLIRSSSLYPSATYSNTFGLNIMHLRGQLSELLLALDWDEASCNPDILEEIVANMVVAYLVNPRAVNLLFSEVPVLSQVFPQASPCLRELDELDVFDEAWKEWLLTQTESGSRHHEKLLQLKQLGLEVNTAQTETCVTLLLWILSEAFFSRVDHNSRTID